jgi:hypothetical protein
MCVKEEVLFLCSKNKPQKSPYTMTKSMALMRKATPNAKKNSVSYVLFVQIVILSLLYAVLDVFFVQVVSSLVLFYDGRRCCDERVIFTIVR